MSTFVWMTICIIVSGICEGQYKRWRQNTNYDNAANWEGGRVPCRNDRLRFPMVAPPVLVQTNATVLQLILPSDGELLLGPSASISFQRTPDNSADCPGKDVVFKRKEPKGWLDPENWCSSLTPEGGCVTEGARELVSVERLPCQHDGVVFPPDNSFFVRLDTDVVVASLAIARQTYDTSTITKFLDSEKGRKIFHKSSSLVTVTVSEDQGCKDPTGCTCLNYKAINTICSYENQRCSNLTCDSPLTAEGTCCQFCGAVIILEYSVGFVLNVLKKYIGSQFVQIQEEEIALQFSMSKITNGKIQIALSDNNGGNTAKRQAEQIESFLLADIKGGQQYGVVSLEATYSGSSQGGSSAKQSGISSGGVSGIAVGILVLLGLSALALFCFIDRRRSLNAWHAFTNKFIRFGKGTSGDVEMGSTVPPVRFNDKQVYVDDSHSDRGFDNPVYGVHPVQPSGEASTGMEGGEDPPPSSPLDSPPIVLGATEQPISFANPLYGQAGPIQEVGPSRNGDPTLKMNPVFNSQDIDDIKESEI